MVPDAVNVLDLVMLSVIYVSHVSLAVKPLVVVPFDIKKFLCYNKYRK